MGLRCGIARFSAVSGHLLAYRSTHFPNRRALKSALRQLLRADAPLALLVLEGDADLAGLWAREASRLEAPPAIRVVSAEDWRPTILPRRQRRSGADAKRFAERRAREIIARSPAPNPTSLRHDAAEAICLGAWAVETLLERSA